jgi:hypothetical protein
VQTIFSLIDQKQISQYAASSILLPISEQAPPPFDVDFDDLEQSQQEELVLQQQDEDTQLGPRVAFRLMPQRRTPLLLVNKATHGEVKDVIDFTLRQQKADLLSSVCGLWFNTLSISAASNLAQHSHFELCCDANVSLAWLLRLDSRFSSCIRSVAIYRPNLYSANGRAHTAWQMRWPPVGGVADVPMVRILRKKLRGLQELAMWFSRDQQICCWHDLSDMLKYECINSLRFLVDYMVACPKEEPPFQALLVSKEVDIPRILQELGDDWLSRIHEAIAEETRRLLVTERPKFNFNVEHSDAEGQAGSGFRARWPGATCAVSFWRWPTLTQGETE